MTDSSDAAAVPGPVAGLAPLSWPVPVHEAVSHSFGAVVVGALVLGAAVIVGLATTVVDARNAGGFAFAAVMFMAVFAGAAYGARESRARRPIVEYVRRTLAARPDTSEAWGTDPERRRVADVARRAFAEVIGWPNDHFLPEDPLELLSVREVPDDVDGLNVNGYLVRATDRKIDWHHPPPLRTLGDLVDAYLPLRPAEGGRSD